MASQSKAKPQGKKTRGKATAQGSKTVSPAREDVTKGAKTVPGPGRTDHKGGKRLPATLTAGTGGKTIPQKDRPTLRQRRLAKVVNPGADDHEKGAVRGEGDDLEWKDERGGVVDWIPAVYHNDIRGKLLAKASNAGRLIYDQPRKRGFLPHDETAFLASQQRWGGDRSLWHHIPDDLLNRLDRLDYAGKDYETEFMFDEDTNRIVLDMDNHPIIAYEDIPLVLSSQFGASDEGWLMEAIQRIDRRIERADFRARMPWERQSREKGKKEPLFTLSSIGNRAYRWRQNNAIVAWTSRDGSKNLRDYVVGLLSEEGRQSNSTRELVHGLSKEQKEEAKKPNKGTMMSKAGKRLVPDDVRKGRENKSKAPERRPNTTPTSAKRTSTKRRAPEGFDDDVDTEDAHDSQRLKGQDLDNRARHDSIQSDTAKSITHDADSVPSTQDASLSLQDSNTNLRNSNASFPVASAEMLASDNSDLGHGQSLGFNPEYYYPSSDPRYIGRLSGQIQFGQSGRRINAAGSVGPGPQLSVDPNYFRSNIHQGGSGGYLPPVNPNDQLSLTTPYYTQDNQPLPNLVDPWLERNDSVFHSQSYGAITPVTQPSLKRAREGYDIGGIGNETDSHRQKRLKWSESGQQSLSLSLDSTVTPLASEAIPRLSTTASTLVPSTSKPPLMPGYVLEEDHSTVEIPTTPSRPSLSFAPDSNIGKRSSGQKDFGSSDDSLTTPNITPAKVHRIQVGPVEDYRFKKPRNATDAEQIDEALQVTRQDFIDLFGKDVHGEKGPRTEYYGSYAQQYASLQQHSISLQPRGAKPVYLNHWGAWTRGFDRWKESPISNEEFLQGMKDGNEGIEVEAEVDANDHDLFSEFTDGVL